MVEGDHGSTAFYPTAPPARGAIACQVSLQTAAGAIPTLGGASTYPLVVAAGFEDVDVTPRQVYVDGNRPVLADGFVRKTFTAMVQGVRTAAQAAGEDEGPTTPR